MASILKVDALQGVTAAGSILVTGEGNSTTTNLQEGLAKIRVSFNQSAGGAQGIYGSFNIASYTDTSTGKALIAFTNNFANTDYSPVGSGHMNEADSVTQDMFVFFGAGGGNYSTSNFDVNSYRNGVGPVDDEVGVIGHGDLA